MAQRKTGRARKGVVIILFGAMMMFVLLPAVGLAVDLGVAYSMKARLQSASDGAAIAAIRSLGRGMTIGARQAAAADTAQRFFSANLQSAGFGLVNPVLNVTFPAAAPKTTSLQVTASVDMPTYFMRLLGSPTMTLKTTSGTSRRDVNIMLVLDRSGSLQSSGSCPALRVAAQSFVNTFQEGVDKVGLVTFGMSYNVDNLLRQNFASSSPSVVTNIGSINCVGFTNSAAAYSVAYDQLVAANEAGVLNVILFFTDGQPNTITLPRLLVQSSSGCNSKGNRFGVVTPNGGVFQALAPSLPPVLADNQLISNASGCNFSTNSTLSGMQNDFVALTRSDSTDANTGDSTGDEGQSATGDYSNGHGHGPHGSGARWDNWSGDQDAFGNSLQGYMPVTTDGSGRIALTSGNILNAGMNALANAADRVRTDSMANGLGVVTYVIGLGNFTGAPALDMLNRVANTPDSPTFDPNKPVGLMIYASDASQLQAAFAQVGSELLRISM